MTIYTIGYKRNTCCGHGDYCDLTSIEMIGGYDAKFPLAFINKNEAIEYLKSINKYNDPNQFVVELNLIGNGLQ